MKTPEWIKPGAMCRTRDGRKAMIYAVHCYGCGNYGCRPIHGAIASGELWSATQWWETGTIWTAENGDLDLIGPWIEKPIVDWSKLPAWANWVAMDENGEWFWYAEKPRLNQYRTEWIPTGSYCDQIPPEYAPTYIGDWEDSLMERPKA